MGREIRMVPPNWEAPQREDGRKGPQPMYDTYIQDAIREWKENYAKWENGTHEEKQKWEDTEYWEYDSPPKREYYRPWKDEEATWYQCWETVSEGTPVTPAFETLDELCEYLALKGDYWDQLHQFDEISRLSGMGYGPWGWDKAKAFIRAGHVCSMMVVCNPESTEIYQAKDIALKMAKNE